MDNSDVQSWYPNDGLEHFEVVYNLHPNLPKNKSIAKILEIDDLDKTEPDRPFWRGNVVLVKYKFKENKWTLPWNTKTW